jgi:hypothetical protein
MDFHAISRRRHCIITTPPYHAAIMRHDMFSFTPPPSPSYMIIFAFDADFSPAAAAFSPDAAEPLEMKRHCH